MNEVEDATEAVQCVQLQPMTKAFEKAVTAEKSSVTETQLQPSSHRDFIQMKTEGGRIVWIQRTSPMETTENLADEVSKLVDYQDIVLKYEKLAEEATKIALEERAHRLTAYERELKRREIEAKKKLAGAVQELQKIHSEKYLLTETGSDAINQSEIIVSIPEDVLEDQFVILTESPVLAETIPNVSLEVILPELSESVVVQHEPAFENSSLTVRNDDAGAEKNDSEVTESEMISQEPAGNFLVKDSVQAEDSVTKVNVLKAQPKTPHNNHFAIKPSFLNAILKTNSIGRKSSSQ